MIPGIAMSGSLIFTQKCGLTERFSLKTKQQTPILTIESYRTFQSVGRSGTIVEINGVGTVEITASASMTPLAVSTPVTRPSLTKTFCTAQLVEMRPPLSKMAEQSAFTNVWLPPSIYPSSSCIIDLRERPIRRIRVHIHAAETFSAY